MLLVLTQLFHLWGFSAGTIFIIVFMFANKTISKESYMKPLFPLNIKELANKFIRFQKH